MDKRETKIIYYKDEIQEDHSGMNIKKKEIKSDYKYIRHNPFSFLLSKFLIYIILTPLFFIIGKLRHRITYKNKKILKEIKSKGFYLYSNHTIVLDPAYDTIFIKPLRASLIVSSHESFSINPIVSYLIRLFNTIPVPKKNDELMTKNYMDCMSYHIKHKHDVILYPERHIWSYYNKIRNFTSGQFRYPVNDNAPSIAVTKTYIKTKFRKRPKVVAYLSGPFYPDNSLEYKERVNKLREEIYTSMCKDIETYGSYEYVKYVKENLKD